MYYLQRVTSVQICREDTTFYLQRDTSIDQTIAINQLACQNPTMKFGLSIGLAFDLEVAALTMTMKFITTFSNENNKS